MTIVGLSVAMFALCVGVIFLGAIVQGTIGIGLGMLAAPVVALADRGLVPVVILVAILPLTISMTVREYRGIDRRGVLFAVLGRLPGVVLGSLAVAVAGDRLLAVLVAVTVLVGVIASILMTRFGLRIATTPASLVTAGAVSGFMGTSTGIGGPPMALTYQHADPAVMRATVAAFFTIGSLMSIGGLGLSGSLGARQVAFGALMIPAVMIGFAISGRLTGRLGSDRFRLAVLAICALSAIGLLVEEFT